MYISSYTYFRGYNLHGESSSCRTNVTYSSYYCMSGRVGVVLPLDPPFTLIAKRIKNPEEGRWTWFSTVPTSLGVCSWYLNEEPVSSS